MNLSQFDYIKAAMNIRKINTLVVDDDALIAQSLSFKLKAFGNVITCNKTKEAIEILSNKTFDLVFIDLNIDDELDGLQVLAKSVSKNIYSVILSSYDDEENIQKAYEMGCQDYFVKGEEDRAIEKVVGSFLLGEKKFILDNFIQNTYITNDQHTKNEILHLVENIASDIPILILGPTGTGKSFLAKKIFEACHKNSPFIELNCAAIPETLLESELFGHEKGAFTGASIKKTGLLKKAHGGVIFLDEISSFSLSLQAKILKAIEEKSFTPVGSTEVIKSNFRIISATCENLIELVHQKKFRLDLYYRLTGANIYLRPLSERKDDIELLIKHFLKQTPRKIIFHKEVKTILNNYGWPGNIRELEKVIQVLKSKNKGIILAADLPEQFQSQTPFETSDNLLTGYIKKHALTFGMNETMRKLKNELVESVMKDNEHKVNLSIKTLKISSNTFYSNYEKR
ncbi:MAG: hypothetical protein A2381_01320 [Bdellovibrionales bacterium RIFOXYB1_FULL_37_110]|nr:MAG: hypothetical protein A2417_02175 [Bdellovibrionales bacterium RIFOXYC1_FULL_37_79]OFZ58857.1 MAG: hypothetical protein A2381_01320 [Bdellovibrionales bacterium RIFOXYB1_FULL_37_110]OFZ64856.1 MAG: hypothetical protein A2577_07320 [Bdellovibrionales bacterium RIFOXYD1_FULL_36_51]